MVDHDKAHCSEVARQYGYDYWDGDRQYGYGGYSYDGRWKVIAERLIDHYGLTNASRVLDVGCGKGYLLHEMSELLPGLQAVGLDLSAYALSEVLGDSSVSHLRSCATTLPFPDDAFDLVISLTTLHNLHNYELDAALREMERVGSGEKYLVVESYRNESEKANLLYWQLTCRSFYQPKEWEWFFERSGYRGDYGCIFFE